jgi:hypothetical protein
VPLSQMTVSDQNMLRQTISASSLTNAQTLVGQISNQVAACHEKWESLASWQAAEQQYQSALALYRAKKTKTPPKDLVGAQPATPDAAACAPAPAFGIPASALPGSSPTTAPSSSPTTTPTTTPKASTSAKAAA